VMMIVGSTRTSRYTAFAAPEADTSRWHMTEFVCAALGPDTHMVT